jgi:hypothetical protein
MYRAEYEIKEIELLVPKTGRKNKFWALNKPGEPIPEQPSPCDPFEGYQVPQDGTV